MHKCKYNCYSLSSLAICGQLFGIRSLSGQEEEESKLDTTYPSGMIRLHM